MLIRVSQRERERERMRERKREKKGTLKSAGVLYAWKGAHAGTLSLPHFLRLHRSEREREGEIER
jgi:hypothetical protein